jgi:hypothetical protein
MGRFNKNLGVITGLLFILLIGITGLNVYLFLSRSSRVEGVLTDYATLYEVNDLPFVKDFELTSNVLSLRLGGDDQNGMLTIDDRSSLPVSTVLPLKIPLQEGAHSYDLIVDGKSYINFKAHFVKQDSYLHAGSSKNDVVTITDTNIPFLQNVKYSVSDWTNGYNSNESITRIKNAEYLISHEAGISDQDTSRQKIMKLTVFLLNNVADSIGIPSDYTESLSGFGVYENVISKGASVWCSNISRMYCAFANLAGVPSREVYAVGNYGNVHFTGHAFAESWIAEERRWAFVDLTSQKALVTNQNDKVLNAVQLLHTINLDSGHNFIAYKYQDGRVSAKPYRENMESEMTYFGSNTSFAFFRPRPKPMGFYEKGWHYIFKPKLLYSLNPSALESQVSWVSWSRKAFLLVAILTCISLGNWLYRSVY